MASEQEGAASKHLVTIEKVKWKNVELVKANKMKMTYGYAGEYDKVKKKVSTMMMTKKR